MSEAKHTPGPWRFYLQPQPNGCPIVGNERGLMVAMLAHSINYEDQRAEAAANANLIAAAPDLLEALQELLKDIQDYQRINNLGGENNHSQVKAKAAIARATGKGE